MIASEFSTSALTVRAALVAGASILLLVLLGRGKPARPKWWLPHERRQNVAAMYVRRAPTELYRPPRWWERLAALVGLPAIGIVLGVLTATAVAGVLIFLFTTLSGRLS